MLPRQAGMTIAAALRQWLPGKPWSEVRRLLKSPAGDGQREPLQPNASCRLRVEDVVKLLPQPIAAPARPENVRIRHLDKRLIVVEKPAGITSTRHEDERRLPGRARQHQPTLDELLPRLIAKVEGRGPKAIAPGPRGAPARPGDQRLMVLPALRRQKRASTRQFRKHAIQRRYLAIARGPVEEQTIESRLVRDRGDRRRGSTTLPNAGRQAITHVRPIERLGDYTLVECRLKTGRTHQIRIHLAELGHPLCGEKVYGQPLFRRSEPDRSSAPRLALCAVELGFVHPVTGEPVHFETQMPADLDQLVCRLRKEDRVGSRESDVRFRPGAGEVAAPSFRTRRVRFTLRAICSHTATASRARFPTPNSQLPTPDSLTCRCSDRWGWCHRRRGGRGRRGFHRRQPAQVAGGSASAGRFIGSDNRHHRLFLRSTSSRRYRPAMAGRVRPLPEISVFTAGGETDGRFGNAPGTACLQRLACLGSRDGHPQSAAGTAALDQRGGMAALRPVAGRWPHDRQA